MEFRNDTNEKIKYRTGSLEKGFDWYTIRPGETKYIPEESARNLPLTEVISDEKVEEKVEERIDSKNVEDRHKKVEKTKVPKKAQKGLFHAKVKEKKSAKKYKK